LGGNLEVRQSFSDVATELIFVDFHTGLKHDSSSDLFAKIGSASTR
jgi:hypothetical protein